MKYYCLLRLSISCYLATVIRKLPFLPPMLGVVEMEVKDMSMCLVQRITNYISFIH